jgi:flagellar hook protein FlgE
MSLFGAMNTAVSGLSAQSSAFGNISDNVANSQTVGYKRVDTSFVDYLTTSTAADNVPGSVVTRPDYVNNVEGTMTQTDNPLGLAITGQGFFAVSTQAGTTDNQPTFAAQQEYTRAGDFQMDKNGYLVNSAGKFLNGWPVTTDPTTGANIVNQNTLQPIQVSQTVFNPIPTTNINLSANLPATPSAGAAYTPADITTPNLRVIALAAVAAANNDVTANPLSATAAAYLTAATTALNDTVATKLAVPGGNTTAVGDEQAVLAAAASEPSIYAPTVPISSQVDVYDALGNMQTATLNWVQSSIPNTWTVQIQAGSPATSNCGSANVTFDGTSGMISNISPTNPADNLTVPAASTAGTAAKLSFTAMFGATAQTVSLNLGTFGKADGLTQFAGTSYNLRGLTQNGVPPGAFSSVSTATNGDIAVNYDNGQSRVIAQVPLITFNDPNGLQRQDGQAFTVSQDSGGPLAETANTNGAGGLVTQSVEGSNVDIATEFSKLIVAQEAYSANTKLVTTASQLLQQTIDMKQ